MTPPKAIIIGASSGIGSALARELASHGYEIGLTARRVDKLEALSASLPVRCFVRKMDVSRHEDARETCTSLIEAMGGVDMIVINAGISLSSHAEFAQEKAVIDVNVTGFVAICNLAMAYFGERGGGHIVGISSIAALKGYSRNTVYCASKSFISAYMQGMRQKSHRKGLNITVSDIRPGFVATEMTATNKSMFWVAPAEKAARQIFTAIRNKKSHAYITRRWRLVAWLTQLTPDWLFVRMPS